MRTLPYGKRHARTRIKICGITRPGDAEHAADAGADAIGLVFYPPSPRFVTVEQAAEIIAVLPAFVTPVGLFVNAAPEEVRSICSRLGLPLVQLHGNETPEYCRSLGLPFVKAVHVGEDTDVQREVDRYRQARAVLLDTQVSDLFGGSGQSFAWERVVQLRTARIVLAGGLEPDNVAEAIATLAPWAVDVSSGVESEKGLKDPARVQAFCAAVRAADEAAAAPALSGELLERAP